MNENTKKYLPYNGQGIVFNIQRWAIQDGPGMRTTVFLKGCPLHCGWCANPESQKMIPEIMTRDILCIGCGKCEKICPQNAICIIKVPEKKMPDVFRNKSSGANNTYQKKNIIRSIQWSKCNQCLKCSDVCPSKAIVASGKEKSVQEVMDTVIKDMGFYRKSNGGMTISGGEPLMQWRFALDLLKMAVQNDIHTALDTTGFAKWDVLEQLLQYTDLLLYDIKSIDSKKHKDQTGVGNQVIIDNLKRALKQKKVWIRRPVIPGFNDSVDETTSLARFISSLNPLPDKISLLPYHRFAELKYESMGKIYTYQDKVPVNEEGILEIKKLLESLCPVAVDIGK
jgi:pyruvate formate lyase activating enzyme